MEIFTVTSYYDEDDNKAFTTMEKAVNYCYNLYNAYAAKESKRVSYYDGLRNEYEMDIIDKVIPESTTYEQYVKALIKDNELDTFTIEKFKVVE